MFFSLQIFQCIQKMLHPAGRKILIVKFEEIHCLNVRIISPRYPHLTNFPTTPSHIDCNVILASISLPNAFLVLLAIALLHYYWQQLL